MGTRLYADIESFIAKFKRFTISNYVHILEIN